MVGFSETSMRLTIKKVLDDAYKSPLSCIVLDDLEIMMDYSPVGPRCSNNMLQALLVYIENLPPAVRPAALPLFFISLFSPTAAFPCATATASLGVLDSQPCVIVLINSY